MNGKAASAARRPPTESRDDPRGPLLARAVLYRWAAGRFAYPGRAPGAPWDGATRADLEAAATVLEPAAPGPVRQALAAVWDAGSAAAADRLGVEGEFTHLFERAAPAPPYAGAYLETQPGLTGSGDLAEVAGYYAAFGFRIAEAARERPDHLALELEFMAALYAKQVYAMEQGWEDQAAVTREARRRFVAGLLAWWTDSFAARVREKARLPLFPAAAGLVQALVASEEPA